MKKEWIVLVLMLCVTAIAVSQAAAHAEAALPEVPEYSGQTEAAMLSAPEDALKYAQKLCEADYFQLGDLTDAYWDIAELEDGTYLAEAEQGLEGAEGKIEEYLTRAEALLRTESLPRNGYYRFVCEKCAPAFGRFGWFMTERELMAAAGGQGTEAGAAE